MEGSGQAGAPGEMNGNGKMHTILCVPQMNPPSSVLPESISLNIQSARRGGIELLESLALRSFNQSQSSARSENRCCNQTSGPFLKLYLKVRPRGLNGNTVTVTNCP